MFGERRLRAYLKAAGIWFLLDAPQRPAQSAQRYDLLLFRFAQDIHTDERYSFRHRQGPASTPLVGFQPSLIGRF
jgi:hypothetical protein